MANEMKVYAVGVYAPNHSSSLRVTALAVYATNGEATDADPDPTGGGLGVVGLVGRLAVGDIASRNWSLFTE